jgi:hypothetical protein
VSEVTKSGHESRYMDLRQTIEAVYKYQGLSPICPVQHHNSAVHVIVVCTAAGLTNSTRLTFSVVTHL